MPERVIAYVDGFNLYFGLCEAGFRRFLWLDIVNLAKSLLHANQVLAGTKYFTARVSASGGGSAARAADLQGKRQRQSVYLDALTATDGLGIYYGHFLDKPMGCHACGREWMSHEEKMTDVWIATEMLMDAHADAFDVALLISGDSDLVPPVNAIHKAFPKKRVIVYFPPCRHSANLKRAAKGSAEIGRGKVSGSQLANPVVVKTATSWRSRPSGSSRIPPLSQQQQIMTHDPQVSVKHLNGEAKYFGM